MYSFFFQENPLKVLIRKMFFLYKKQQSRNFKTTKKTKIVCFEIFCLLHIYLPNFYKKLKIYFKSLLIII